MVFILLILIFSSPAFAGNNVTITCDNSSCSKSTNLPLFSETNIYPSFSISQTTTIKNTRNTLCNLSFKTINNSQNILLSDVINIKNYDNQNIWYNNTLKSLFNNQYHSLGTVNSSSSKDIIWTATFDKNAGNIYQNISTNFDIDFNFSCDEETIDDNDEDNNNNNNSNNNNNNNNNNNSNNNGNSNNNNQNNNNNNNNNRNQRSSIISTVANQILGEQTTIPQSVLGTQDIKSTCNFDLRYLFVFVSLIFLNILFRSKKLIILSIILIILSLYYFRCIFDTFSFSKLFSILN